jgi:hypothetical protein
VAHAPKAGKLMLPYYLAALGLTITIELVVAAILGLRSPRDLAATAGANMIIHPMIFLCCLRAAGLVNPLLLLLILESFASISEAVLMKLAVPKRNATELLCVSTLMNVGSFLAGVVLLW